jgi:TetR/AcrR family tetracycline transcriptional repressor
MSLYHYVPSKAALLDAMVERLAGDLPPLDLGHGWRACLSSAAAAWLGLARRHPGAFPLLATRAQARPAMVDWYVGIFEQLRKAGFGPLDGARVATSFFVALNGFLLAAGRPLLFSEVPEPGADARSGSSPQALRALAEVPPDAWNLSSDDAYAAHVAFLLDGVTAALARRQPREPRRNPSSRST